MRRWKGSKSKSDQQRTEKAPVVVAKPRPSLMMALEPRMMFDAAAVTTAEAAHADHTDAVSASNTADVVFVDARVKDSEALLADVAPGTQVVRLDAAKDGLQQIASYLSENPGATSVQIIAEGYTGDLWLGSTYLSADNVAEHATTLAQIGAGMQSGGDILIFGCRTGAGEQGSALVTSLATLTGRDVAASDDRTGARGDWDLEIVKGTIESSSALSFSATAGYVYDLATITVTNNADSGVGTLREALDVTAVSGDTITFNAPMDIALTSGALVIDKNLTIDGDLDNDGSSDVTLDANYTSGVLTVTAGTVSLQGLVLREGLVSGDGGGYEDLAGGDALGAGLLVTGAGTRVTILDSVITANRAAGGGGGGAGDGYSYGGGGGGGTAGIGGGSGGAYNASYPGAAGSGGIGGNGGYDNSYSSYGLGRVGKGGSTTGGAGGIADSEGLAAGGAGATANGIGGGGGGAGRVVGNGGRGGDAAGGIYIGAGATVYMARSTVSLNSAAGGGGGGSYNAVAGAGGAGTGGIRVLGTLKYESSTTSFSSNSGVGADGGATDGGMSGASGSSIDDLDGTGGSVDMSWTPPETTPPTVSSVSVPSNATYTAGQALDFTVNFDEAVIVDTTSGSPRLALTLDTGGTVYASYVSGSGTTALIFSYTVMSEELDTDGITVAGLENGEATLRDAAGNDADLTLNNIASTTGVLVDAVVPSVDSITRVDAETSNASSVQYTVTFTESVTGVDVSDFSLDQTGTVDATIDSITGSGTTYTVTINGITGDGLLGLDLNETGTGIIDAAGNAIDGGYFSEDVYVFDHTAPGVISVGVPEDGTYSTGQTLEFTVSFGEDITVDTREGAPRLALTLDTGGTVYADYVPGSSTSSLTFSYTVQSGELDSDGISITSLDANGALVTDVAGNDAVLTLNGVGDTTGVLVDAVAPSVASIVRVNAATTNATSVQYTVTFSEDVSGVDTSFFSLTTTGDTTGTIDSISGEGTTYTVTVIDITGDGTLRLDLNASGTEISDGAGNAIDGGFTDGEVYTLDYTVPSVTSVSVPTAGTYITGQNLDFTINFDESVTVDTTGGTPRLALTLDTGGTVYASYVSGSGTTALVFSYTVMSEELDSDGIAVEGLESGEATLRDAGGNDADLTLNNVASTTGVLVDAVVPRVDSITLVDTETSNASSVQYTVTFTESVSGVDATDFSLSSTGTVAATIDSISGSGTTYTVTVNNITGDGMLALDLNESGTAILDEAGNAIDGGYFSEAAYTFDHTAPSVTSVSVPEDGTYTAGQTLEFTVSFDEDVTVDTSGGAPRLALTLDTGGTVYADYVPGSSASSLTFSYTVQSGELDSDGISIASVDANGALVTDLAGNDAVLTLMGVGDTTGVLVDAVAPSVASIVRVEAATTNATSVSYTVTFSEGVSGVDTSFFSLTTTGDTTGTIDSISGSGTTYTVTVIDITGDGTLRLDLNASGTEISDGAGNAIDGGFTDGEVYTFDYTVPTVASVDVPADGTYITGQSLDFTVNFDESITVDTTGGTPRLALTLDTGGTVYASYVSGSGTTALVFSYTVMSEELDSDGITVGGLESGEATLRDAAGNDANLTLNNVASTTGVLVDAVAPGVASITRVDTQTSNATSVQYTVTFTESVTGVDTADFALTATGTAAGTIASVSGSGTTYTVTINSITGDGTLRLDLNGSGTGISDTAGNAIGGGFTGDEVYTFDHTAPSVISVSVPENGTYSAGQTLEFTVSFDEGVTVDTSGGAPRLALTLDTGGTVYADYVPGSSTSSLTFSYTVQSGELDSDGISIASVDANGALVTDLAGNDADLTLIGVGDTTGVLVDAVAPSVASIVRVDAATTNATSVSYTVTFSEAVSGVDSSFFSLTTTGDTTGTIDSITGSGTTYTVTVIGITGDGTLRLDLNASGTEISDGAGNAIDGGFTDGEVYTLDYTAPSVTSVSVPTDGTYITGQNLDFTVNFDESITVATTGGTPYIEITLDTGGSVFASYLSGSGTSAITFRYTVASGNLDSNGLSVGASIVANGGTIRDTATNDATLTLNGVGTTTGVLVEAVAPTVTSIDRVTAATTNATSLQYTVTFSESVTGVDVSDFLLTATGTASGSIASVSGSGTTYTVTVSSVSGDGTLRLDVTGSGITDAPGNGIASGFTTGQVYTVDHTAPSVSSVTIQNSAGSYSAENTLELTVNFNESVIVDTTNGTPRLAITLDTGTVYASYLSGSGTAALTFLYQVVAGDLDLTGIALGASIDANGGTLRDSAGNDANTTLNNVADTSMVLVDTEAPTVTSITRVGPATTNASSVQYTVTFSESVTGVDASDFTLTATGDATGTVASITGSGTTYTVTVNGITGDGSLRLDLISSSTGITDTATNATVGGFTSGEMFTFDFTGPHVTSVNVPSSGIYSAGQHLDFTVAFDEVVTVGTGGGTPYLELTVGSTSVQASYVSGSGTNELTFRYTAQAGDVDADGLTVGSLIANGGTFEDDTGNDADLTLNSVGSSAAVLIDAVAPSVISIERAGTATTNATSIEYIVTFSESVTGVDAADFALTATGTAAGTIASVSGGGTTYTVTVSNLTGDGTLRLDLNGSGTGLADLPQNAIVGGFTGGQIYTLDHTAPTVTSVSVPAAGTYTTGQNLDFIVNFSESVSVADTAGSVTVEVATRSFGDTGVVAVAVDGTSNTFTHTTLNFGTAGVAQVDGLNVQGAVTGDTTTGGAGSYDFSADLAQFDVDGISVTLSADYENEAALVASIQTQLGAAYSVSGTGAGLTISKVGSLVPVVISNTDTNAQIAGFANSAGIMGTAATATTNASFAVDGETITLNASYANTQALADAITGQLSGYTASVNEGSDTITLVRTGSTTAVAITDADTNAIAAGFTNSAGSSGSAAVPSNNASFAVDGYAVTLNQDYVSFDALAAALDSQLDTASGGDNFTVTNNSGVLTIARNTTGTGSAAVSITAADTVASAAGFGNAAGTAGTAGEPRIALTLATGGTVYATYVSGNGTSALTFRHVVASGELDADGISLGNSIELNGAVVYDVAGNQTGDLTLNGVGETTAVFVDAQAPSVASIVRVGSATTNATSVEYTVTFSESVTGVDVADFALTATGTVAGTIASVTGSGTTYTVTVNSITGDGTLRLDLGGSGTGITDAASNAIGGGFTSGELYTFDHTAPSVVSVSVPASGTYVAGEHLDFTVTFSESVTVVTAGTPFIFLDLDTGGTVQASYLSGSGSNALQFRYTVASGNFDSNGVSLFSSIVTNGSTLRDLAGNDANLTLDNVDSTTAVTVDAAPPSVASITRTGAVTTNASSVTYTVTFFENVTGVDLADFALTATGTVTGTIASISGSGTTYTVTVNDIAGDGTLRLDLKNGTDVSDLAGNAIDGFNEGAIYIFDHTAPSVTAVSVAAGTYTAGQNLDLTVSFDENVTVDTANGTPRIALTLDTGGTVYASYVSGSGTSVLTFRYTVMSGVLDRDGIVADSSIEANGGTLRDNVGNDAMLALNNVDGTAAALVDAVAPSVTSITRVGAGITNATSVQYTVTFSESVTNVNVADFALTATGTAAGTIASVSGSGTTYTVTVDGIAGDGTLRLDLNSGRTGISDTASNPIGGDFTGGEVYTFDHTGPSVTSVSVPPNGAYVAGETLDFTVNFDESVLVDATGGTPRLALMLDTGGTVYANYVSGNGTAALTFRYTVMSGELDSDGISVTSLDANGGTLRDSVGNDAATTLNGVGSTTGVLVDTAAPSVATITRVSTATTNATSVQYTVTFAESVTGVDVADFALTATGTAAGTIASISGSGSTYTVTVNGITGNGTLRLDLNSSGTGISDTAGNALGSGFTSGDVYTFDHVAPSVTAIFGSSVRGSSTFYTVVFSENVTGVNTADFSLTATGTVAGTIASISGSGTTYTVVVNGITGEGTLRLDVNGTGITDIAGNSLSSGFTSGYVSAVDHIVPRVASVSAPANGTYIAGQNLDFVVHFDENVTVETVDSTPRLVLSLDTGGTVFANYLSSSGSTATFRYTVSSGQLDSTGISVVSLAINGSDIHDSVLNPADLTLNNVDSTAGVLVDAVAPNVASIVRSGAATTSASSVAYTVTFSEAVSGVDITDFALTTTGATTGTIAAVTQVDGSTYTVTVNGITGDGTLRLDASGTGITDVAGTALAGAFKTGEVYTLDHTIVDTTGPAVVSVGVPRSDTYVAGETLAFTVSFDESVTVDTTGGTPRLAITLDTGGTVYASYVSGSGTAALTFSYTVLSGELDGDGISVGNLEANGATLRDSLGNDATLTLNGVGSTTGVLVDAVAPSVASIVRVDAATSNATSVQYTVTFSESVTGVSAADFALTATGTAAGTIASITGSGTTYTVTINGITGDGTLRLDLAGTGTGIVDVPGTAISSGFTDGEVYTFDHTGPSVTTVSVPMSGTYTAGETLDFTVNFDESITVDTTDGTPRIALTLDTGGTVYASYVSGSGTSVLTFRYTMDVALDTGIVVGGSIEPNGGILRDGALNDATLTLNGVGDTGAVRLDGVAPAVATITANGSSFSNATSMAYTVTFSEDVSGVDIADFSLSTTGTVAGTIESITQVNGSTYIVNVTGITGDGSLRLDLNDSGTAIVDRAGNPIAGGLAGDSVDFDHSPPVILGVDVPAGGAYGAGEVLEFRIRFDDTVTVDSSGGSPRLALLLSNSAIVYADYVPDKIFTGSTLTFRYLVADDFTSDGISVAGIDLNGGRLVSPLGVDVDLTLNGVGDVSGVSVDAVAPSIASITRLAASRSNADSVTYLVTFSEDVSGIRAGSFSLTTTGTLSIATGAMRRTGGNTFLITISGIRGDGTLQLHVNGAGVTDLAGTALGSESIAGDIYTFDHTPPSVVTVDLPANGNYVAGQSLDLTVNFNENVTVDTTGGKPRIAITLGSGTVYADYVSGSGTTALTFRYVVGSFDVGPNGVGVASSVELNGATMMDAVGNRAELAMTNVGTLPGVTVGARANIVVTPPPSRAPASNPIIITQLPAGSVLPPILNAFNTSGGGIAVGTSPIDASGAQGSMEGPTGALPNRETGGHSTGNHSSDPAPASTANSGFITLRDNRVGETSVLRAGAALQPLTLPANRPFELSLPAETFIGGAGSRIAVEARLADGKPLPTWLKFDPRTGKFVGTPPPGQGRAISIQVIARDGNGEAAVVVLDLQFGADEAEATDEAASDGEPVSSTANEPALEQVAAAPGKASLNSQFRAHGFNAWQQRVDTLVQHARESARSPSLSIDKVKQS